MKWDRKSNNHWVSGPYTINVGKSEGVYVYMAYYKNEFVGRDTDPAALKRKCDRHASVMGVNIEPDGD